MDTKTPATVIETPVAAAFTVCDSDHLAKLKRIIAKRSFCTLATTSPAGFPYCAGVVYQAIGDSLWIHTMGHGRKGLNIAQNPRVAVVVPFRKVPVGPPYTISFQATAELIEMDDRRAVELIEAGRLDRLTGHNELEMVDGCFIAITPVRSLHSFGPGASMLDLIRDPINTGGRSVTIDSVIA